MKAKILIAAACGISGALMTACHNDDNSSPPPPPPASTAQTLDTQQVLTLAQQTSETSEPFAVNGGAVTITGTSESTAPIAVNAM